jgi:hypothetical protein
VTLMRAKSGKVAPRLITDSRNRRHSASVRGRSQPSRSRFQDRRRVLSRIPPPVLNAPASLTRSARVASCAERQKST